VLFGGVCVRGGFVCGLYAVLRMNYNYILRGLVAWWFD